MREFVLGALLAVALTLVCYLLWGRTPCPTHQLHEDRPCVMDLECPPSYKCLWQDPELAEGRCTFVGDEGKKEGGAL